MRLTFIVVARQSRHSCGFEMALPLHGSPRRDAPQDDEGRRRRFYLSKRNWRLNRVPLSHRSSMCRTAASGDRAAWPFLLRAIPATATAHEVAERPERVRPAAAAWTARSKAAQVSAPPTRGAGIGDLGCRRSASAELAPQQVWTTARGPRHVVAGCGLPGAVRKMPTRGSAPARFFLPNPELPRADGSWRARPDQPDGGPGSVRRMVARLVWRVKNWSAASVRSRGAPQVSRADAAEGWKPDAAEPPAGDAVRPPVALPPRAIACREWLRR